MTPGEKGSAPELSVNHSGAGNAKGPLNVLPERPHDSRGRDRGQWAHHGVWSRLGGKPRVSGGATQVNELAEWNAAATAGVRRWWAATLPTRPCWRSSTSWTVPPSTRSLP